MMNISLSYAGPEDLPWLAESEQNHKLPSGLLRIKIQRNKIIVAKSANQIAGWLRFGFFWDEIPFLNMLWVNPEYRLQGIGKRLVEFWELEMRNKDFKLVMTSSQSDEEAQYFYRKIGYKDAGSLVLPKEPLEILFTKEII